MSVLGLGTNKYEKDVETDAAALLLNDEDLFKEAIKDDAKFGYNYIDGLDTIFYENINDRSYSPEDAIFILRHCEHEETDRGLWEGVRDWREELSIRAARSYGNDVWFKTEEIYKELKDKYGDLVDTYQYWISTVNCIESDEDISTQDAIEKVYEQLVEAFVESRIPFNEEQFLNAVTEDEVPEDFLVGIVWKEFEMEHTIKPIDPDSPEALDLLRRWIKLGENAGLWGDTLLGESYIDTRCGSGHGMPEVKMFVDFDHEIAYKLPQMQGKNKDMIVNEIKRLEEKMKENENNSSLTN